MSHLYGKQGGQTTKTSTKGSDVMIDRFEFLNIIYVIFLDIKASEYNMVASKNNLRVDLYAPHGGPKTIYSGWKRR